jgi:hypothetical protein
MASAGFGTPQYEDEKLDTGASSTPDEAPQELLDPNDPALTSETLDVNTEGDAYAVPVPPPDRLWRARLKVMKPKDDKNQEFDYLPKVHKSGQKYFATGMEATIVDPSGRFDGLKAYDQWVGTFMGRDGATKAATILGKLRKPDGTPWATSGTKLSHKGWIELLVKALAGEPEAGIESQWEWSCSECGKAAKAAGTVYPRSVTGMHKFSPSRKVKGEYDPEMKCQMVPGHGYSRARVRIANVVALADLKH